MSGIGGFYIFNEILPESTELKGEEKEQVEQGEREKIHDIVALVVFRMIDEKKYYFHCRISNHTISDEDNIFIEQLIAGQVESTNTRIKSAGDNFQEYKDVFVEYFDDTSDIMGEEGIKGEGEGEGEGEQGSD